MKFYTAMKYILSPCFLLSLCMLSSYLPFTAQAEESEAATQSPYVSELPQYTFPKTLPEQEESLRTNPLLKSFAESRQQLAADPYRPLYHFTSPRGKSGDPNGLSFYKGKWHLFYQFFVQGVFEGDIIWGHTCSDDLVHWRDLPPALYRGPEENCWSGSVCIDNDRAVAAYYGNHLGAMVAVSDDPLLLNWEKISGTAVIPLPNQQVEYNVFDSCIWKKDGKYYILSAGCQRKGSSDYHCKCNFCTFLNRNQDLDAAGIQHPGFFLFESSDLIHWNYLHQFVENDFASQIWDDGACPYFWPIGDQSDPATARHILLHFSHTRGAKYLIGQYDKLKDKFFVSRGDYLNHGAVGPNGLHAPTAFPDGHGGVVSIFNVNSDDKVASPGCVMSIPILFNLAEKDQLLMKPVDALESLRRNHITISPRTMPANEEIVLENVTGRSMEFNITISPQTADAIEIKVLRSANNDEYTRLVLYPNHGTLAHGVGPDPWPGYYTVLDLDSSHSSLNYSAKRPTEQAQVFIPDSEPIRLRIFVDRSIVEVFANDRQILVTRVFPSLEDSTGVSIKAMGGESSLDSFDAWQMAPIFPSTED
ncbi:MAG: glycoside hydrolase family 32 protein [Planctomycetia bacterium]|nr:glycoside hydrolase family 32 protein [Planctomycetia bacterium]